MEENDGGVPLLPILRGVGGALVGAGLGFLAFTLVAKSGLLLLGVAGALTGLGCGMASRRRLWTLAFVGGAVALLAEALCQYWLKGGDTAAGFFEFLPRIPDQSSGFLLRMGFGVLMGAWFGLGRNRTR